MSLILWYKPLALLLALLCIASPLSVESQAGEVSSPEVKKNKYNADLRVVELTSKNFASTIGDGNIWLIEFYTPWCRHCQHFEQSYTHVALAFHSSPKEKIRVGKVDSSAEKALTKRFGVQAFPTFFLVDRWSVYEFEDQRSEDSLLNFARGGYKQEKSIPFLFSPMGPMGLLQQLLIDLGGLIMDIFQFVQTSFGMSPILTGMMICILGIFGGMISIVLLTIITTPRAKVD